MIVELTPAQLMALRSLVAEHFLCAERTEVYIDVAHGGTTTPEDLFGILMAVPDDTRATLRRARARQGHPARAGTLTRQQIAEGLARLALQLVNSTDVPDGWKPDEWAYLNGIAAAQIMQLHERLTLV